MKVLLISTVQEFFRQRAGMFFVILGVLLGFMSSREHYAFALFFLTDRFGMLSLFLIWLFYAVLCVQFVQRLWSQPAYSFIFNSRLWTIGKQCFSYFLLALGFLQPLLMYGVYLIFIAMQEHLLHRLWLVFTFYLLLSLLISATAAWRVRHAHVFVTSRVRVLQLPFARPVSWIYWSLEWLVREKGLTFLICKSGALGVVLGTLLYYKTGTYDLRLPAIGMSLGYLLNAGISFELYRWESEIWLWNRSLPWRFFRRAGRIFSLHAIIILPETIIAVRQNVLSVVENIQLYGLGLSILLLFHTYLYRKRGLLEDMMKPVLLAFAVLTLLLLYKIPLLVIAATIFVFLFFKFPGWYCGRP
jgi:hypothetical protein